MSDGCKAYRILAAFCSYITIVSNLFWELYVILCCLQYSSMRAFASLRNTLGMLIMSHSEKRKRSVSVQEEENKG
jgi:hypothetical protein